MLKSLGLIDTIRLKLTDLGLLTKFRLSSLVVLSAMAGYFVSLHTAVTLEGLLTIAIGGFLVTGAANVLNQVFEIEYDRQMKRTQNRPLAAGRMYIPEAVLWAGVFSLTGTALLLSFNLYAGILGLTSLVLYAFIYTPLKRISPVAVWVGALPGALPVLIGGVAAAGYLTPLAICLFLLQVIWQFSHFWAIAWVADDDYRNAGFKLLPSNSGEKDSSVGFQAFVYNIALTLLGILPYFLGLMSLISTIIIVLVSILYAQKAWYLYRRCDIDSARKLMFSSFLYLPVVLLVFVIEKMLMI